MSESPGLTPDPLPETLARFTPAGIDRDALLFRAGQAAARPPRGWKIAAGVLAVSQAVTLALLIARTPTPVADVTSRFAAPAPPPLGTEPGAEPAPAPHPAPAPWREPPAAAEPDESDAPPPPPVALKGFQPHSYGAFLSATAPERLPPLVTRSRTGPDLPPISVRSWERVRVEE